MAVTTAKRFRVMCGEGFGEYPAGRCGPLRARAVAGQSRLSKQGRRIWTESGSAGVTRTFSAANATAVYTISFNALSGMIFTTLRAGFALNTVSSPVNGLIPLRALVAGFLFTLILNRPGMLK